MRGVWEGRTPTTSSAKCRSKGATDGMGWSKSSIRGVGVGESIDEDESLKAIHDDNVAMCESSIQAS